MMRSRHEHQDSVEPSSYRELQVLSEVEANPEVSQRELSGRVGIALGLVNVMVRNLAQKGYIRVSNANWKRRLYALTPDGFSHKIRLTVSYIHRVLDHYQKVRQTLREQLVPMALNEESRVALYGTGEFAELVYLGLREIGIEEINIFGPIDSPDSRFLGIPVRDIATLQPQDYDRILVAYLDPPEEICAGLQDRGATPEQLMTFFPDGRTKEIS